MLEFRKKTLITVPQSSKEPLKNAMFFFDPQSNTPKIFSLLSQNVKKKQTNNIWEAGRHLKQLIAICQPSN